ncbi:hypothetical protein EVAR_45339_1 [Eumeta japonica]|uniref:Uncharacterized protein n=1 Tax=Eumeta variegata TaxID=151549 RepID=A0A4C1XKH7_EUMVA|nr:hypothetical protein EVAR_45339_1 [Eumeta japonica]
MTPDGGRGAGRRRHRRRIDEVVENGKMISNTDSEMEGDETVSRRGSEARIRNGIKFAAGASIAIETRTVIGFGTSRTRSGTRRSRRRRTRPLVSHGAGHLDP